MSTTKTLMVTVMLGVWVVNSASAQQPSPATVTPPALPVATLATPSIPERSLTIPRPHGHTPSGRPDRPQLPQDVKALVSKFQQDREAFLEQQKNLAKQQKSATDDQRAAIRDQMRENLDKWREEQSNFRQELRDRIKDMKSELQNSRPADGPHDGARK